MYHYIKEAKGPFNNCNIITLRRQTEEFRRLRARPRHPFRKVPPGAHFNQRATACCRRLRLVKRGRAAELTLSKPGPHILSDLKYSNLSLFDTATRILQSRFLPEL